MNGCEVMSLRCVSVVLAMGGEKYIEMRAIGAQ